MRLHIKDEDSNEGENHHQRSLDRLANPSVIHDLLIWDGLILAKSLKQSIVSMDSAGKTFSDNGEEQAQEDLNAHAVNPRPLVFPES